MYTTILIAVLSCFFQQGSYPAIGSIERLDPALDKIISTGAVIEIISEGYEWSEGPLWLEQQQVLIFSDVPRNTIYQWSAEKGTSVYLTPSGYTGTTPRGGETGSNGLLLDKNGKLVLCQHGDRKLARMEAPLDKPAPVFSTVAGNYNAKKFNSPNDAVLRSNGDLFFTDPPYGLEKYIQDPLKELPFQGVYKVTATGKVTLLTDSITRPNGIALMPGEKTLVIANSDGDKPYWYAYDLGKHDALINPRIFCDGAQLPTTEKGGGDGLKIDRKGNVYATGPGGVWIFNRSGKVLGHLKLPVATSNCALADDEKTLYITADMYVLRVKMRS